MAIAGGKQFADLIPTISIFDREAAEYGCGFEEYAIADVDGFDDIVVGHRYCGDALNYLSCRRPWPYPEAIPARRVSAISYRHRLMREAARRHQ